MRRRETAARNVAHTSSTSAAERRTKYLLAFVIVKRNETTAEERAGELARLGDTSSSIRIIAPSPPPRLPLVLRGSIVRGRITIGREEQGRRVGKAARWEGCALKIHAFIQRGPGNPARQERCYEKWMGQFSISRRLGPRTRARAQTGYPLYYAYTHIYLRHERARARNLPFERCSAMSRDSQACRRNGEPRINVVIGGAT